MSENYFVYLQNQNKKYGKSKDVIRLAISLGGDSDRQLIEERTWLLTLIMRNITKRYGLTNNNMQTCYDR